MDDKKKTPPPPRAEASVGTPRTAPPPREKKDGTAPPSRRGAIDRVAPPPRKSAGTGDGNSTKPERTDTPSGKVADIPADGGQAASLSDETVGSSSQPRTQQKKTEADANDGKMQADDAKPKPSLLKPAIILLLVLGLAGGYWAYQHQQELARQEKIEQEKKALLDLAAKVFKLRKGLPEFYDQYDAALEELTALVPLDAVGTDEKAGAIFRQKLAFQFAVLAGGWRVEVFGDGGKNIELLKHIQADQELTLQSLVRSDVPGQAGGVASVIAKAGVKYPDDVYFGNDTFVPATPVFSNYLDSIRNGPAPVGVPLFAFARAMDNGRFQEKPEIRQAYAQHPKGIVRIDDKATWERRQREIQRDLEERQRAEQAAKANKPKPGNSLDDALRKFKNAVRLN